MSAAVPAEAYTAGERFQLEKRRLFARAWLPIGAAAQVAAPGDFVNQTLGGFPIAVIRDGDGTLHALRNVCKHQGMPVLEKPAGSCETLRCRYHGWTYDRAGRLIVAPPPMTPKDPASPMHHLDAVELTEAERVLFVRGRPPLDGVPPTLGIAGSFAGAVSTDIDANWKSVLEALLPDAAWRLAWPIALVGAGLVRLVMPRTFTRTRLIDLDFGAGPEAGRAADAKAAAQALQQRYAAGDTAHDAPAVTDFRARLDAALAG